MKLIFCKNWKNNKKYKSENLAFFHISFISLEQSEQFTNPKQHLGRLDIMVLMDTIWS